ncbi:MAG: amidohydrolase family protein [Candidatus Aminicenantes bacterium]|nr:MAG: amidohydrolase family protein [Candidatus Aminicenantes bacterium]
MNNKTLCLKICFSGLIICLIGFACSSTSETEHYDILIKNTNIVDGTGKAAFKGGIAIKGEKIAAVGKVKGNADTEIDGSGLVTCPGFIDPHSHADMTIMRYPLAGNLVMQGITTVLTGNCGQSPAPTRTRTLGQWLSQLEEKGIAINFAPLVGHATVRVAVMGNDFKREATAEEIENMKTYVDEAMRSGAFGLSSFADPAPGEYASLEEFIALAKVVQKYGGLYVPHTRHIQSQMPSDDLEEYGYGIFHGPIEDVWVGTYKGYLEAIEISRKADIPLHIAHFSNAYKIPQPHPEFLDEATAKATLEEVIDKAKEEGIDITLDTIPCSSSISGPIPMIQDFLSGKNVALNWVRKIKKEEFIEKLKTKEFRGKLRKVYDSSRLKLGMIHTKEDPYWMNCFKIEKCKNKEYVGKTIGEIARMRDVDGLETIFDLLIEDPDTIWIQFLDKRLMPEGIPVILKHPLAMPCTDMRIFPAKIASDDSSPYASYGALPSPIAYGLYPHYISTYVREKGSLSLEEAVKKATYFPAQRLGLKDRGILSPETYADIVVFNLETIEMSGDFLNPAQPPEGIEFVIITGKIVYKEKAHTGEKPGKVLRNRS